MPDCDKKLWHATVNWANYLLLLLFRGHHCV